MMQLQYFPICPFSRFIRLICYEKELKISLKIQRYWERDVQFLSINPAGELPVLKINDDFITNVKAIAEFLEETITNASMIYGDAYSRAKIRTISNWFHDKFHNEVSKYVIWEKFVKYINNSEPPSSEALRVAKSNSKYHLEYIEFLTRNHLFLAGDRISLADLAAASEISTMDYFGEISWSGHDKAKEWYALIKSRPSMRNILKERITGFPVPSHYENPDF